MADSTMPSFPTYAELTQTNAWAGGAPVPVAAAVAGTRADQSSGGRYTEGAVLGVGGMGKVVLARDARIGRDVAVKVLHSENELSEEDRQRFLREAQVQGQLEHPSIVPVYDIDRREDGTTFFTMRRVMGRTLASIIDDLRADKPEAKARYTQRELLQAFVTVCLTVDYAHSRGVVHRDLKPANIMLGDFGEVYVLDWGLARILPAEEAPAPATVPRLSAPGSMMGTPLYMAPEQMADPEVGPPADVFALGAILFEILTLQRVRNPRALYAPVDARPSVRAPELNVAPELEMICVKATQMLIAQRYPSARALQEAVAAYLEGDRAVQQRRELAAEHARRAREALDAAKRADGDDEREQGIAMREAARAIAMDPTGEHVAMFGEILQTPPKRLAPEIVQTLDAQSQAIIRFGSWQGAVAILSWFAMLPVILWLGVRRVDYMIVIAVPASLSAIVCVIATRQQRIGRPIQYAMITTMMIASMGLSRLFGPLILMPMMIATWVIVLQAHPDRPLRVFALAVGAVAITLPMLLELAGVLPASYVFADGRMQVLPQMHELPRTATIAFMFFANIAMVVMPALFVAKLRSDLAATQVKQLVQAWHVSRLPRELMTVAPR